MGCDDVTIDPTTIPFYQRRNWANPLVRQGSLTSSVGGGGTVTGPTVGRFAVNPDKNLTFGVGYLEAHTRITAFEASRDNDVSASDPASTTQIQIALFTINDLNRLPLAYVPGSETPPINFGPIGTVGTAAYYYAQFLGGDGWRIPFPSPLDLLAGWYVLAVCTTPMIGFTNGTPWCDNPRWPAVKTAGGTFFNGNYDGNNAGAPAIGHLSGLNLTTTIFTLANISTQAQIAWTAVCQPI